MQYTIGHRVYPPPSSLNLHSPQHADFIGPISPYSYGGAGPTLCVSVAESGRFGIVRDVRDEVALRVSRSIFQLL